VLILRTDLHEDFHKIWARGGEAPNWKFELRMERGSEASPTPPHAQEETQENTRNRP